MSYLADAVALGDLNQSIRADGQGEMLDLQVKVNRTVQQLNTFVEEIARVAVAAGAGDFTSMRVPDVQASGRYVRVCSGMGKRWKALMRVLVMRAGAGG